MKNKRVKQMMVDVALKGRKLYWFEDKGEEFLAQSAECVAELLGDFYGKDVALEILEDGIFGEIKMSHKDWFKPNCYDFDLMRMIPSISAVYGTGTVQISTSYA